MITVSMLGIYEEYKGKTTSTISRIIK